MKKEEIKYVNYQILALVITLITSFIAIIITYNRKLSLEGKEKFLSAPTALRLTYFNRITLFLIGLLFLYINYQLYKIAKIKNQDLKNFKLQILASILVVASEIIAFYVVTHSEDDSITNVENPNI